VAEIVVEFSWSEYAIDDNLSRFRWIPRNPKSGGRLLEGKEWNEFPMKLHTPSAQCEMQFSYR